MELKVSIKIWVVGVSALTVFRASAKLGLGFGLELGRDISYQVNLGLAKTVSGLTAKLWGHRAILVQMLFWLCAPVTAPGTDGKQIRKDSCWLHQRNQAPLKLLDDLKSHPLRGLLF